MLRRIKFLRPGLLKGAAWLPLRDRHLATPALAQFPDSQKILDKLTPLMVYSCLQSYTFSPGSPAVFRNIFAE